MQRFLKGAAAATALLVLAAVLRAGEEKVALDKLPKAVVDAVKAKFPKGEMKSAAKEVENGKTIYEVTLEESGHKIDASVTEDGKFTSVEKVIDAKDLPKPVAAALEGKYPKATCKVAEEVTEFKDGEAKPVVYEVLLETIDNKQVEVVLTAEGKITKEEAKAKGKD
jgi:hypothetical protein